MLDRFRARVEAIRNPQGTIRKPKELLRLGGQVIKYTRDGGETWRYARVTEYPQIRNFTVFGVGVFPGVRISEEIIHTEHQDVHSDNALFVADFTTPGFEARRTKPAETATRNFSYDFLRRRVLQQA